MILEAGLLTALLLPPPAQEAGEGSAAVAREAEFARTLAAELGFDDLAEQVLDKAIANAQGSTDRGRLLLARCEVRRLAAGRPTDPSERLVAFRRAADAYQEFLAVDPPTPLASKAQTDLGRVATQYGETLLQIFDSEELEPAREDELRDEASKIFEDALRAVTVLINWFEKQPSSEGTESAQYQFYYPSLFYRGLIYYYWGSVYPAGSLERKENCRQALDKLDGFVNNVGMGSKAGMLGFKYMADAYAARGDESEEDYEQAEIFYRYVIDEAVPEPDPDIEPLSPQEIASRQEVVQQSYKSFIAFLESRGRTTDAFKLGQDFLQWLEDENVFPSPDGYRVMLGIALLLNERGDYSGAMELAAQVAEENQTSILRLEANEVTRRILSNLPEDAQVDLGVLYEAAEGAYFQDKFREAIEGFRNFIPRLAGSGKEDEYGPRTYVYLGRAWAKLGRDLESAAAFRAGYQLYPYPTDEEFSPRLADGWFAKAEEFVQRKHGDAYLTQFRDEALAAKTEASGGDTPDAALWRGARTAYEYANTQRRDREADSADVLRAYDEAIAEFRKIPRSSRYYERALVHIGLCHYWKSGYDAAAAEQAFKAFDDYLEVYVANPENDPIDAGGRKIRKESKAQADYYRGQVRVDQAQTGGPDATQRWESVLRLYTDYEDRHPDQIRYAQAAAFYRIQAFLALGRTNEAVAEFDAMAAEGGNSPYLSPAAFSLYQHYESLSEAAGDAAKKREMLSTAANYLHLHNTSTSQPAWQNMVKEAQMRLALDEPATAAEILEEVLSRFEDEASFRAANRFDVKLDLVDALLAQDQVGAAEPYVKELYAERPNVLRVKEDFVKIMVGYPVLREGEVLEVPGVGEPEAFADAEAQILDLTNLADAEAKKLDLNKYLFRPFWVAQLQAAYFQYARSKVDSTFAGQHRSRIESLERLDPSLGGNAGAEDIARILRWLKNK